MLRALIDTVLANNYDLRMAEQRVSQAKAQLLQSRAPLLPQLNTSVMPSVRKFGLYTMDGAGNISTDMEGTKRVPIDLPDFFGGIQASWEIDLWGKLKSMRQSAAFRVGVSEEYVRLMKTLQVAETAALYFELLAADEELEMVSKTIALQEEALELMRIQKQAGRVNELAVQQFEAQWLSMRDLQLQVEQQIVGLETSIRQLTGRLYQPILRDTLFFDDALVPQVKAGIPAALLLNRPDIRMAEKEILAAGADLQASRRSFYPMLLFSGGVGIQGYRLGVLGMFPESIAYSMISNLVTPVFNRRGLQAQFARSLTLQKEATLQYEKTVVSSFNEVRKQLIQFDQLNKRYVLKEKETQVLTTSIGVAGELFRTGRANYLDVLLANQRSLMSNVEKILTRKEQLITVTNIYRSLGGGWK
jgi:NodT family efflux transporter outer membrane factor (OMF) lipoprotein